MLIGNYRNGNYDVRIYSDGTKIRENDEDNFTPEFPESMDLKITNYCDQGCAFCHENSSVGGKHGNILGLNFINTLRPYTEIAIGGGDPLSHPDLIPFLEKLKKMLIVASITVHQECFANNEEWLRELVSNRLIHGLGVSIHKPTENLLNGVGWFKNSVIHVVNGIIGIDDLKTMYDRNLKVLILGYKKFRRGETYYSEEVRSKMDGLYEIMPDAINRFDVVSFDNLAIGQLNVKRLLSDQEWNEFYMGDDGQFTMYIDAVKEEYAQSSTSIKRYGLADTIDEMFNTIRLNKSVV